MVSILNRIVAGAVVALLWGTAAFASCTGQLTPGEVCGVAGSSNAVPSGASLSSILDRNFGAPSPQGSIVNRGSSLWSATVTPVGWCERFAFKRGLN